MDAESFIKVYDVLSEKFGNDSPMLVHFRIATQGLVNRDNCHPFRINNGALIHNGSFWYDSKEKVMSDTSQLTKEIGKLLDKDTVLAKKEELDHCLGTYNKVALLYSDKEVVVFNRPAWHRDDQGILYSHGGYKNWREQSGKIH